MLAKCKYSQHKRKEETKTKSKMVAFISRSGYLKYLRYIKTSGIINLMKQRLNEKSTKNESLYKNISVKSRCKFYFESD